MNRRDFIAAGSGAALLLPLIGRGGTSVSSDSPIAENRISPPPKKKVIIPPEGKFYHGFHPGRPAEFSTGTEDDFTDQDIIDYESKNQGVDKKAAFIYFSNNWNIKEKTIRFPHKMCDMINKRGSIPFIRLMLRSTPETNELKFECKNGKYKKTLDEHKMDGLDLDEILGNKKLGKQLEVWGNCAGDFKEPIIVEWGTEMNGAWFEWNGWWNGKADGVRKFKQVYNYIRQQIEDKGGADNITWAFHVNASDYPANTDPDCKGDASFNWNKFEDYYPGDFIDIFGVSIYGAQKPTDTECVPFADQMQAFYERFQAMGKNKPVFVLEFGATNNSIGCGQASPNCADTTSNGAAKWADDALQAIFTNTEWKMLRGFSWWNEAWQDEVEEKDANGRKIKKIHKSNMRVQDNVCLKEVFQKHFNTHKEKIVSIPLV